MQRILILKADLIGGEALRAAAEHVFPQAAVVLVSRIARAHVVLEAMTFDLLVTGLDLPDGDALDFVFAAVKSLRRAARVLVVAGHPASRVLELLHGWGVEGVFDPSSEGPAKLERALRAIAAGRPYWSAGLREELEAKTRGDMARGHVLSPAELVVLAVIGDGCDSEAAAQRLGRSAASIETQRRNIHRKLGLRHKGELVQYAAQHGFVRFTRGGVVRPGFEPLRAAYQSSRRSRKRGSGNRVAAA